MNSPVPPVVLGAPIGMFYISDGLRFENSESNAIGAENLCQSLHFFTPVKFRVATGETSETIFRARPYSTSLPNFNEIGQCILSW